MHPQRWKTIEETFHAALERDPTERSRYLDSVCANDPELRREVDSLLSESSQTGSFMERPAADFAAASLGSRPKALAGTSLKHYRIGPLLGAGGMAEVYRARDTKLERDVAVKVLHSVHFFDKDRLDRLYREARLLASLNHPNVAAVYGLEESNGTCALILELVEGQTLSERIAQGSLPVETTIDIARQIAAGVSAAHAKGIIHRDLKPSNIKITPDGTVKVLDFGLAKLLQPADSERETMESISRQGLVVGTLAYMSPEQARGKPIDARTDVWAFGCVLYETLTGTPAFQGETLTDIIVKIASEEPDWNRLPRFPQTGSVELQRITRKCMQKDPESRYQSLREVAVDLESVRRGLSAPASNTAQSEADFVLPGRSARPLFLFAQFGYVALYGAAMYYIEAIGRILTDDFLLPASGGVTGTIILAMWGVAVRIYLISAVGWHHPAAGKKFHRLFPALLLLDSIWAASPLLLWRRIGYGIALVCVAMMAYVPFAQRTLIRSIYHGDN